MPSLQENRKGLVLIGIYVDDLLIIRDDIDINKVIDDIKKLFKVKVEENLKDYLSCKIRINENMKTAWISQPHLVQKLREQFGNKVDNKSTFNTPGTPSFRILKSLELIKYVDKEKQIQNWSGSVTFLG